MVVSVVINDQIVIVNGFFCIGVYLGMDYCEFLIDVFNAKCKKSYLFVLMFDFVNCLKCRWDVFCLVFDCSVYII